MTAVIVKTRTYTLKMVDRGKESPREAMIGGAARLLAERGLQETSFSEVLKLTGAPRGSIYHHFPEGKDQLVRHAVEAAGDRLRARLEQLRGRPAEEVAAGFLAMWRHLLVEADFRIGCSATAVTVATVSTDLLDSASNVFREWTDTLASLLTDGGIPADAAQGAATLLIAGSEGAVVLSRAQRAIDPFDAAARGLESYIRTLAAS